MFSLKEDMLFKLANNQQELANALKYILDNQRCILENQMTIMQSMPPEQRLVETNKMLIKLKERFNL